MIKMLKALERISAELPELTKAIYQLLEETRALRRSIEEASPSNDDLSLSVFSSFPLVKLKFSY